MATKRGKQKQIRNVRTEECRRGNSHRSDLGGAIWTSETAYHGGFMHTKSAKVSNQSRQNLDGEDARKMCGQAFWGKRTDELGGHNEAKSREFALSWSARKSPKGAHMEGLLPTNAWLRGTTHRLGRWRISQGGRGTPGKSYTTPLMSTNTNTTRQRGVTG